MLPFPYLLHLKYGTDIPGQTDKAGYTMQVSTKTIGYLCSRLRLQDAQSALYCICLGSVSFTIDRGERLGQRTIRRGPWM